MLIFSFVIGCQSDQTFKDTYSPNWWITLTNTQKAYYAEVYRIGIGIAYWQCQTEELKRQSPLHTEVTLDEVNKKRDLSSKLSLIIQDRIRLAQSSANNEQNQWLIELNRLIKDSTSKLYSSYEQFDLLVHSKFNSVYPRVEFIPNQKVILRIHSTESPIELWNVKYSKPNRVDSLWYYHRTVKEPHEIRNPMAKLLQSILKFPVDTGLQQAVRWEKMVLTGFDHPNWQLGNLQKKTRR